MVFMLYNKKNSKPSLAWRN